MATSLPGPQRQPLQQFMPRTELTMQQAVLAQSPLVENQAQFVVGRDLARQHAGADLVQGQAGAMPLGVNGAMPEGWFQSVFGAIGSRQTMLGLGRTGKRGNGYAQPGAGTGASRKGAPPLQPQQQMAPSIQTDSGRTAATMGGIWNPSAVRAETLGLFALIPRWNEGAGMITPFGVASAPGKASWGQPGPGAQQQQYDIQPPEVRVKYRGEGRSPFPPLPGTTDTGTTSTVGIELGGPEGDTPCPEGYDVTEDSWIDVWWMGTYIDLQGSGKVVSVEPAYSGRKVNEPREYPRDSDDPTKITQALVWALNKKIDRVSGDPWSADHSDLTILDHPGDIGLGKPLGFTGTLFMVAQLVWHFKARDPQEICAHSFDFKWCFAKSIKYKDMKVVPNSSTADAYDGDCRFYM